MSTLPRVYVSCNGLDDCLRPGYFSGQIRLRPAESSAGFLPWPKIVVEPTALPSQGLSLQVASEFLDDMGSVSLHTDSGCVLELREPPNLYAWFLVTEGQVNVSVGDSAETLSSDSNDSRVVNLMDLRTVRMEPTAACDVLLLSAQVLHATLVNLLGRPVVERIRFDGTDLPQRAARQTLAHMVRVMQAGLADENPGALAHDALNGLLSTVTRVLLIGYAHNHSDELRSIGQRATAPRHVQRAIEYMQENADRKLTMESLADVTGVTSRTLQLSFRRFVYMTPMEYFRQLRMQRIRLDLLNPDQPTSVSEIAARWGFSQLGALAAKYKAAFGEYPSETLAKRR